MLEILGNTLALISNPKSIGWFLADGYRRKFEELQVQREIFGNRPAWKAWLDQMDSALAVQADWARLGVRRRKQPTRTIIEWPSPFWLTRARRVKGRKRPLPCLIKGNMAKVFVEAYRIWYAQLSSFAHQRAAGAQMAIFTSRPDDHWEPGGIESIVVSEALLFFAAIMSEIEVAARMPPSKDLRSLWPALCGLDEEAKRFVQFRYRRLMRLGSFEAVTAVATSG
jgi:hypothetical protein